VTQNRRDYECIRKNLLATICYLSGREHYRVILGNQGVISAVINLMQFRETIDDLELQEIGLECLVNLAANVRPEFEDESHIISTILNNNSLKSLKHRNWKSKRDYLSTKSIRKLSEKTRLLINDNIEHLSVSSPISIPFFSVKYSSFQIRFIPEEKKNISTKLRTNRTRYVIF